MKHVNHNWIHTHRRQTYSDSHTMYETTRPVLGRHSRFHPWPTSFHSLYNSPWLCHLKELNQIPPLCWWHPVIHFFHSFKFNFFTWNTFWYFLWHTLLDELKQIAPQSIQNWISTHYYKTTTAQISSTHNFISRQWYHPSLSLSTRSSDSLVLSISYVHMSEHLWVKRPFLSLLQDSWTFSHQTLVTRYLFWIEK